MTYAGETYEIAVIGAGPAGTAAALQLRRSGVPFLLVAAGPVGGLLHNAGRVENYPGFSAGIDGPRLAAVLAEHLRNWRISVTPAEIVDLRRCLGVFELRAADGAWRARRVIVACGTRPLPFRDFPLPAEAAPRIHGDITALRPLQGKEIAIVGGGDAAYDYALTLSAANPVILVQRGARPRCLPLLDRRCRERSAIIRMPATRLTAVALTAAGRLLLTLYDGAAWSQREVDHLLFAVGREPADGFVHPALRAESAALEAQGLLWWAGDVRNGRFRQAVIAAGDGVRVAMAAAAAIEEKNS